MDQKRLKTAAVKIAHYLQVKRALAETKRASEAATTAVPTPLQLPLKAVALLQKGQAAVGNIGKGLAKLQPAAQAVAAKTVPAVHALGKTFAPATTNVGENLVAAAPKAVADTRAIAQQVAANPASRTEQGMNPWLIGGLGAGGLGLGALALHQYLSNQRKRKREQEIAAMMG